ncbi:hypothetical protein LTR67_004551 [Exophiala xenobiotica]
MNRSDRAPSPQAKRQESEIRRTLHEEGLSHVKSSPPAAKFQRYFVAPVRIDWLAEVQLLLLTFSTGIQDAISFPGFHCFASK